MKRLKGEHQRKYLKRVVHEIEVHKYLQSEKAGRDLGNEAVTDWVQKYGKSFRRQFVSQDHEMAIKNLERLRVVVKKASAELKPVIEALIDEIEDEVEEAEDLQE